ncbi:hypothetical protein HUK65_03690 [Rhodobacteraceae bacterium 2376]|uniref:Uncharacterized protein n=1 Tax=Rhabdonatronobacter sediminivivens TaxID=2743469 RepID=A0A7Z0KZ60_9RHOB|nr:hypothetical protein [Rhabdonatronobacter sediminivivens]NYS24083.1 hypothetical protein [Rhabdonatronobacter sediminivivens]
MRYYFLFRAVTRHPRRFAAFAAGMALPLLGAALVLAVLSGGLSDTRASPPPAFVVETFD